MEHGAKFVFLHSSLAKMPCGGRVDKSDQWGIFTGNLLDTERGTSSSFISKTVQMFVRCPVCKDD